MSTGVTAAAGFRASGVAAGLKSGGASDVSVIVNDGPNYAAAGVFTSNRFAAAPVLWSKQVLTTRQLRAVVLNSGGANACTGPAGFADTHHTAEHAAQVLECGAIEVAICSTGLIGEPLDMSLLLPGVDRAISELAAEGGAAAAEAIMTTDTKPKTSAVVGDFTVGGMAKGAGMLAPGMATMLSVITTDAVVDPIALDRALNMANARTFNRVDSDGCMSTNDTVLLLASGASGVSVSDSELLDPLSQVCADLSRQLVSDAEGASKEIRIEVRAAATELDAETAARSVARSNLFKCAMFGEDPNWGRILSAVGTTDCVFEPDQVDVAVNGVWVCRAGGVGDDRSGVSLSGRQVEVTIDLGAGTCSAEVWTNDLTHDYVHENSAYST
ncbi:MAG: bifunctional ornithine acetyltransferase/N-acetylglutamate synthase [Propionibacteriaceae bacterium]|nr:bifunctional ornithine acetyltransferase/N-acetylglutamate synthase [Propionibacteriaceae bacterium]